MLFQNLLLIIRQLQPSVDFAVRDQQEIILEYRKHEALNDYIEQDIFVICPLSPSISPYLPLSPSTLLCKQKLAKLELLIIMANHDN